MQVKCNYAGICPNKKHKCDHNKPHEYSEECEMGCPVIKKARCVEVKQKFKMVFENVATQILHDNQGIMRNLNLNLVITDNNKIEALRAYALDGRVRVTIEEI